MSRLFSKILVTLLSVNSALVACDSCDCERLYIGAFGGGIYSNSTEMSQMGTAFFTEAAGGRWLSRLKEIQRALLQDLVESKLDMNGEGWSLARHLRLKHFFSAIKRLDTSLIRRIDSMNMTFWIPLT